MSWSINLNAGAWLFVVPAVILPIGDTPSSDSSSPSFSSQAQSDVVEVEGYQEVPSRTTLSSGPPGQGEVPTGSYSYQSAASTYVSAPKSHYVGPRSVVESTISAAGLPCLTSAQISASIGARQAGCTRTVPTATPADPTDPAQPAAAAAAARAPEPIVITSTDVSHLLVDGSGITRQPPGSQVLVNLDAIVYTSSNERTMTTTVNGTPVTVVATPVSYTWTWGDGTTTTTTDPGAAYPNQTVTHRYASTAQDVTITLTTTWTATFTPDGQHTQPVTGTITTTDTTAPFDVVRTISYLTDDAEEAQGH